MKKIGLLFAIIFCTIVSLRASQINRDSLKVCVETLPEFKGCITAFNSYIISQLKYPELASIIGVSGRTVISFVIDKEGKVLELKPGCC